MKVKVWNGEAFVEVEVNSPKFVKNVKDFTKKLNDSIETMEFQFICESISKKQKTIDTLKKAEKERMLTPKEEERKQKAIESKQEFMRERERFTKAVDVTKLQNVERFSLIFASVSGLARADIKPESFDMVATAIRIYASTYQNDTEWNDSRKAEAVRLRNTLTAYAKSHIDIDGIDVNRIEVNAKVFNVLAGIAIPKATFTEKDGTIGTTEKQESTKALYFTMWKEIFHKNGCSLPEAEKVYYGFTI